MTPEEKGPKKPLHFDPDILLKGLDAASSVTITNESGVIIYANASFCRKSKFSAHELVGETHRKVNSGTHTKVFWKKFWNTILAGRIWRGEIRNKKKDGSFYWTYATIIPILNEQNEPYQFMSIRSDISAKKQIEETQLQIKNALIQQKNSEIRALKNQLKGPSPKDAFIGTDVVIRKIFAMVDKVAPTNFSVLIEGESGTGKEMVAKMVHDKSPRAQNTFLAIDAGAIPDSLFESEFFGHEKGAFTDAHATKKGYFETCHQGTLFLDEIGNLSPTGQSKLLRVLQEKEIKPVGASSSTPVDVRMVFATNLNLDKEVKNGRFREDLFYRIAEYTIQVPSLRDRKSDIEPLAHAFLQDVSIYLEKPVHFSKDALQALIKHCWTGNVRELKNRIRRSALMSDGIINASLLFPDTLKRTPENQPPETTEKKTYQERIQTFEKNLFESKLNHHHGNKLKVATELGMYYATFCRKLKKLGIT
ncbi:MAG: PAS domain S-box-containing protein [Candidatus Marinamargulisbacteria bacterium]|jgi:PAS domain S-box-containing protein